MKIEIDGVELTVEQTRDSVSIKRKVGRDRKRKLDITSGLVFSFRDHKGEEAETLLRKMKQVAKYKTAHCTCDYGRGWSDHAEHCQSIYTASSEDYLPDD